MGNIINIALGFILLLFYIFKNRGIEKGMAILYRKAQETGNVSLTSKICNIFLKNPIRQIFVDYQYLEEHLEVERIPQRVIDAYCDDSLQGYADFKYSKGGDTIETQQRGLILPYLEKAINRTGQDRTLTIVEIGTGNGDVVAYLSDKYPEHNFIGVDFSVAVAQTKHIKNNLSFKKGYILDMLESYDLSGDIVFASSTLVLLLPKELKRLILKLKENNFSQIVLSEPVWDGYILQNSSQVSSKHMGLTHWAHNYAGYLLEEAYSIADFNFFHYIHPLSPRPDIYVCVCRGVLA
ncbi:MAG: methyltransferase domain-containing protein [Nitrospirae bacterium]|nr:methyltransferase domain-containing protein [Nitrospirota bacterium]